MKKLIIFLLLLPALAWAGPGYIVGDCPTVPSGCSTPTGDVIWESFGDCSSGCSACVSGGSETCEHTWTESGDSATFHAELPSGPWSGDGCTYGLLFDAADAAENGERIYIDVGDTVSYETSFDASFTLYISTDTSIATNGAIYLFYAGTGTTGTSGYTYVVVLTDASGTEPYLKILGSAGWSSGTLLTKEQKYTIFVHSDGVAANSYYTVNGGSQVSFTRYDANLDYIVMGAITGLDDGERLKCYVGNLYITTP